MNTRPTHWPALIVLIALATSIIFLLILSAVMALVSMLDLFAGRGDPAGEMISAFAFGFSALLLTVCAWFVLQKTMGKEQADLPFVFPFSAWQYAAVIGIVFMGIAIGAVVSYTEIKWLGWFFLPLLTIFVVVPPIWLIFGLGTKGIELGPRWRFFAVLGMGLTVGPVFMVVIEVAILLFIITLGVVYLGLTNPAMIEELSLLSEAIRRTADEQAIMEMLTPYLINPAVLMVGVGYIALLVPIIEELLKPLAVWMLGKRIASPAQGFALGMLSGAAFALIESLNASADGSASWAVIVVARAGTSILHMTGSGLVGWGIASAFKERRIGRLIGAYLSAVLIHGIWNACAAGAGISALGESLGRPEWLYNYTPAMIGGLLVMGIGMTAILLASNRKLANTADKINTQEDKVESNA